MITSKQRAFLRGLANSLDPCVQIGKANLTPEITKSVEEAFETRELIKVNVQKNSTQDIREIADIISERTHSEIVQIVGGKLILFKKNKKKPVIDIESVK